MPYRNNITEVRSAILEAMEDYKANNARRAASTHRQESMTRITDICNRTTQTEVLLEELEDYFSSDDFYTGILDGSVLEEMVVDAIVRTDQATHDGLNTFCSYKPKRHFAADETPPGAQDSDTIIQYHLNDLINFAIDKYIQEKHDDIEAHRKLNIDDIKRMMAGTGSDKDKITEIREYINGDQFTRSFFKSDLKKYITEALDRVSLPDRQVATRIWIPPKPIHSQKVIVFLHGWHDSLNAGDQLARQAVKQGFKVISYDQRGHGKDAEREKRGISTDLLRLDFRKFLEHVKETNSGADISLAGHSLGGAILTAESRFIQEAGVKNVSLIAPAIMSSIGKMISPAKILYRNMHKDVEQAQRGSNRFGGKGPTLFGLLNFMRKIAETLRNLFVRPETREGTHWRIYSGKKDQSVNYSEFEGFTEQSRIKFFSRGDHALHFGHRYGTVVRQILKDIHHDNASRLSASPGLS